MNIEIVKGTVKHSGKDYGPGCDKTVIKQIKREEGQRLIDLGFAVDCEVEEEKVETSKGEAKTPSEKDVSTKNDDAQASEK